MLYISYNAFFALFITYLVNFDNNNTISWNLFGVNDTILKFFAKDLWLPADVL